MDHVQLRRLCFEHGVFLRREAKDLGYHDTVIDAMVRQKVIHRVRWGSYTFTDIWKPLGWRERYAILCRAAVRRANTDVVLSHLASAQLWGAPLWDQPLHEVDLTRPDGRAGRRAAGIRQHQGVLLPGDVVTIRGQRCTSATRMALELTTIMDVEHALVEIDWLLHHGHTTHEQLHERLEASIDDWPNSLRARLVLHLMDGRSESVGETRSRYACWAAGLPAPIPNFPIYDRDGTELYRVDLAWPDHGVFLEFDGKEKYLRHRRPGESIADCIVREKKREDHVRELTGWRCIRIVWSDLRTPVHTTTRIQDLLARHAA